MNDKEIVEGKEAYFREAIHEKDKISAMNYAIMCCKQARQDEREKTREEIKRIDKNATAAFKAEVKLQSENAELKAEINKILFCYFKSINEAIEANNRNLRKRLEYVGISIQELESGEAGKVKA